MYFVSSFEKNERKMTKTGKKLNLKFPASYSCDMMTKMTRDEYMMKRIQKSQEVKERIAKKVEELKTDPEAYNDFLQRQQKRQELIDKMERKFLESTGKSGAN